MEEMKVLQQDIDTGIAGTVVVKRIVPHYF